MMYSYASVVCITLVLSSFHGMARLDSLLYCLVNKAYDAIWLDKRPFGVVFLQYFNNAIIFDEKDFCGIHKIADSMKFMALKRPLW